MEWITIVIITLSFISLAIVVYLLFKRKNPSRQSSMRSNDSDSLYSWNTKEQTEILTKLVNILDLPPNQAKDIASCILAKFINSSDPSAYNCSQITELALRVQYGGELSKDVWKVVSECIQAKLGKVTEYTGRRVPNLLIQQILGKS
jgi:hypothetical protein